MITTFKIDCNFSADYVDCTLNTDFRSIITADWNVAFTSSTQCYKFSKFGGSPYSRLLPVSFKFYQVTDLHGCACGGGHRTDKCYLLCPLGPLWPNPANCLSIPVTLYAITENRQIYRTFMYIFMSLILKHVKSNSVLSAF